MVQYIRKIFRPRCAMNEWRCLHEGERIGSGYQRSYSIPINTYRFFTARLNTFRHLRFNQGLCSGDAQDNPATHTNADVFSTCVNECPHLAA